MTAHSQPTDLAGLFAIRDARGIDAAAKAFLFVVASRGVSFARVGVLAADMGVSVSTYYRVQAELVEAGLIDVQSRPGKANVVRVRTEAVQALVPNGKPKKLRRKVSQSDRDPSKVSQVDTPRSEVCQVEGGPKVSQSGSKVPQVERGVSQSDTHKENKKRTTKGKAVREAKSTLRTERRSSRNLEDSILGTLRKNPDGLRPLDIALSLGKSGSIEIEEPLQALIRKGLIRQDKTTKCFIIEKGEK